MPVRIGAGATRIVRPTGKLTPERLAERAHFARRAGADVNRAREARKGFGKGGRNGGRQAAIKEEM